MENRYWFGAMCAAFWTCVISYGVKAYGKHKYLEGMAYAQKMDKHIIDSQEQLIKELTKKNRKEES